MSITQEELKASLHYDPVNGVFRWAAPSGRWDRIPAGSVAGCKGKQGYTCIRIAGRLYYAHRLAWLYMTGSWPSADIDHISGDRSNNSWANLRAASRSQNLSNKKYIPNSSGMKGVHFHKASGLWMAAVTKNYKQHVTYHKTPEAAFIARNKMAESLHGEFARAS